MNTSDVIHRYAQRQPNPRQAGRVEWHNPTRNCYCEGRTLYSYGSHFPIAVHLGEQDGKPVFLKNGDRYSVTTSSHQSATQYQCHGPTVSASALRAANINFRDLTAEHVVDWTEPVRKTITRHADGTFTHYGEPWTPPRQGMFVPYRTSRDYTPPGTDENTGAQSGTWHILGATLMRWQDAYYLCGLDEGRYFVAQLRRPARTVTQAFEQLKPRAVQKAEAAGLEVQRQGEWFFVPTGQDDKAMRTALGLPTLKALRAKETVAPLPPEGADSNLHVVKQIQAKGRTYATGKVFHRRRPWQGNRQGDLTREHRTLNLGVQWFQVHRNTQVAAWSMGGTFD